MKQLFIKLRTFKTASTAKQKTWVAIISMKMSANAGKLVMNQGAPLNHEQSRISTNYRPHEGSVRCQGPIIKQLGIISQPIIDPMKALSDPATMRN
ncbi:MAG: hypothetical protein LZF63_12775, partial [Nitrosomonas sp.]|nr:hypothetical protein [Nitrosomonas sp.]